MDNLSSGSANQSCGVVCPFEAFEFCAGHNLCQAADDDLLELLHSHIPIAIVVEEAALQSLMH